MNKFLIIIVILIQLFNIIKTNPSTIDQYYYDDNYDEYQDDVDDGIDLGSTSGHNDLQASNKDSNVILTQKHDSEFKFNQNINNNTRKVSTKTTTTVKMDDNNNNENDDYYDYDDLYYDDEYNTNEYSTNNKQGNSTKLIILNNSTQSIVNFEQININNNSNILDKTTNTIEDDLFENTSSTILNKEDFYNYEDYNNQEENNSVDDHEEEEEDYDIDNEINDDNLNNHNTDILNEHNNIEYSTKEQNINKIKSRLSSISFKELLKSPALLAGKCILINSRNI